MYILKSSAMNQQNSIEAVNFYPFLKGNVTMDEINAFDPIPWDITDDETETQKQ